MKKRIALLLALLLSFASVAFADDLGVTIIGEETESTGTVSLDDLQTETVYSIDGYAKVEPLSFEYVDFFAQYEPGEAGKNDTEYSNEPGFVFTGYNPGYIFTNMTYQNSGEAADFALFKVDITNLSKQAVSFMKDATVTVYYNDDEYEFAGWVRQYDYDLNNRTVTYDWVETGAAAITPQDELEIATMYTGHYAFGCTLPNAVVQGTESLKMVIELGGNELTYIIRK